MRLAFREKPYDRLAVVVLGLALVPLALLAVTGAARIQRTASPPCGVSPARTKCPSRS